MTDEIYFNEITLLITHFNRSISLCRLLAVFKRIGATFKEIIVSDGGSTPEHLSVVYDLQKEYNFTLFTTDVNYGLGHTINTGQKHTKTPYILYVQEDFVPRESFVRSLTNGLAIMKEDVRWDIVRFYSFPWATFPYLKPYKNGFSEMIFKLSPFYLNHQKFNVYSDHPHLKRITFPEKFGPYLENINGDVTEMAMCRSFLKNKGRGLMHDGKSALFDHVNSTDEPGLFRPETEKYQQLARIKALHFIYLKYKAFKDTIAYTRNL